MAALLRRPRTRLQACGESICTCPFSHFDQLIPTRLIELAHTFCVAAEVYKVTVILYGQPTKIFPFPFLGASTSLGGLIAFLVHVCTADSRRHAVALISLSDILLFTMLSGTSQVLEPDWSILLYRRFLSLHWERCSWGSCRPGDGFGCLQA